MLEGLIADSLTGQRLIVTGAASGLGRAATEIALASGMRVLAVDRDSEGLRNLSEDCQGDIETMPIDLADADAAQSIVARAVTRFGGVDALFHAAAMLKRQYDITTVTPSDYDAQYAVNQRATWLLARNVAEQVKAQGGQGAIVLVSSLGASTGGLGGSWLYASTKGAVEVMVRSFARQYGGNGIRTNAISPGTMDTPMLHRDLAEGQLDAIVAEHVPLQRAAAPAEVANVGLFLMSAAASYVNGVTIDVDGGWNCR